MTKFPMTKPNDIVPGASSAKSNTDEEAAKRECNEEDHCVTVAGMGYKESFEQKYLHSYLRCQADCKWER